jgi:hypothetical protein
VKALFKRLHAWVDEHVTDNFLGGTCCSPRGSHRTTTRALARRKLLSLRTPMSDGGIRQSSDENVALRTGRASRGRRAVCLAIAGPLGLHPAARWRNRRDAMGGAARYRRPKGVLHATHCLHDETGMSSAGAAHGGLWMSSGHPEVLDGNLRRHRNRCRRRECRQRPRAAILGFALIAAFGFTGRVTAVPLDRDGSIRLSLRTYVNARVGTEHTDLGPVVFRSPRDPGLEVFPVGTFPPSAAGHVRQNRYFLEAELNHDVESLVRDGVGPFALLADLPVRIQGLRYTVTFRGEGDTLYDWGPREYSTASAFEDVARVPVLGTNQAAVPVAALRQRLRDLAAHRARLFQAFVEGSVGRLFVRFGRQNLSWGETDGFRLLDNINPLDNSFGGVLISLDERRVPLDMLRAQYTFGGVGPFSEAFLEGYVAIDDVVGFDPPLPAGTAWAPPGTTFATVYTTLRVFPDPPARTVSDARGGARLVFNAGGATWALAHYYTYLDLPATQVFTNGLNPLVAFDDGLPCPRNPLDPSQGERPGPPVCGYLTHSVLHAARAQITGGSMTFAVPSLYAVVRSEFAYIRGEAGYTQGQIDPVLFTSGATTGTPSSTGGITHRNSYNFAVGLDVQQFVRFLNPTQTFFFSAQLFYKHIAGVGDPAVYTSSGGLNPRREVLPVASNLVPFGISSPFIPATEPIYITEPADDLLNTLLVSTSYLGGQINPLFVVFYDWGGSILYQPSVTLSRDPFRFTIGYSLITAATLKGGSGLSLIRDKDNVEFRLEYVL